ncbi:hypothetical protein [Myroides fluvii]|uniref:hypothetical protein n=1 Tax=Myroides fluvii TaxID=2572594 RepID=UPI00131BAE07|nr:hypothetical protein [Myroides fluvii]
MSGYNEYGFIFTFCKLTVPPLPQEPDPQPEPEPEFPEEELGPGKKDDEWKNNNPPFEIINIEDPFLEHGPVWWYHSDHLSH